MTRKQVILLVVAAWLVYSLYGLYQVPAEDVARHGWTVVLLGALAYGFGTIAAWAVVIGLIVGVVRVARRAAGPKAVTAQVPPPSAPSAPVNEER